MGGGQYSFDVAREARSRRRQDGGDPFDYSGYATDTQAASERWQVHPLLDFRGQTRECMNDQCIVVAMDVTRSRGDDAKVVYERLPQLIGWLELQGYLPGAAISFAAIGDATCDQAPVQISQWERDNRLDEALSKCWLEEGGGGTGEESYELTAYFYARHTRILPSEKGRKGYFFFIGDEAFYPQINREQVASVLGHEISHDIPSHKIFQELSQRFHVFFIYPKKTWQQRRADIDAEIAQRVRSAGGRYDDVDVRFSLIWNTRDDLDLHVIAPSGEEIWYSNKRSGCGGELDVDRNVRGETLKPVENIRWARGTAPTGSYEVYVQNYRFHERRRAPVEFKLEVEINGVIAHHSGIVSSKLETGSDSNLAIDRFRFTPRPNATAEPAQADAYANYDDAVIRKQWEAVLPDGHLLSIDDPQDIIEVMVGAVGLTEEKTDLDGYLSALDKEAKTDAQRKRRLQVAQSLGGLAAGVLPVLDLSLDDLPSS